MHSGFVWGSQSLKRLLYPSIGRGLYYMSFLFTGIGILMILLGLFSLADNLLAAES